MKVQSIWMTFLGLIVCGMLMGQSAKEIETDVTTTYAVKLGRTPAIKSLVEKNISKRDKKKYYKDKTVPPRNFAGRYDNRDLSQKKSSEGPDPLRQTSFNKSNGIVVEPIFNIEGNTTFRSPHDPTGDVGQSYYMHAINATTIALYDKNTGALVDQFSGNTLWNTLGFSSGGDPIILYDQEFDRWIITEFPSGFGASFNQLLVAISVTGDPMGSYDVYNFSTPDFPDYPKYAVWSDAYSVTTNEEGPGVLHGYYINREELLAGAETVRIQRVSYPGNTETEAGFFVATPVDWSGKTPPPSDRGPIVLALNDSSWNIDQEQDQLEIFSLDIDWDNSDNTIWSRLSLEVSPYDSYPCASEGFFFSCIPQPANIGLDGIPETIMHQAHYRNFGSHESIVLNFITDVTAGENLAGIRWMELRRSGSNDWSVYQEGTFAPDDNLNRFMGGIAMDAAGNIALAYNVANDTTFAGIRFTGRRAGDPLGEMTVEEYVVVDGTSAINDGSRFGDYAHMAIDPVNERTFWYTTEYGGTNGSRTRIIAYELTRDTFDIGISAINNPMSSAELGDMEIVNVSVRNFGLERVDSFTLGLIVNDQFIVEDQILDSLEADSIYVHAFSVPIDMGLVGDYDIQVYSSMEQDSAFFNDSLSIQVQHIAEVELVNAGIRPLSEVVCGSAATLDMVLLNEGAETIDSATVQVSLNGAITSEYKYIGNLAMGASEIFQFPVESLLDGMNTIEASVISVNGGLDFDQSNNNASINITSISNGIGANLNITFDDYPDETSWVLESESGIVLYQSGNYENQAEQSTVQESLCLNPDSCYVLRFRDSYGDGIAFGGVVGYYDIIDDAGVVLARIINPEFGSEEVNSFCARFECNIQSTVSVAPVSASGAEDGVLMVDIQSGAGPFSYSIDGGNTVQDEPVFDGLSAGIYEVISYGLNACSDTTSVEVLECQLEVFVDVQSVSAVGLSDGSVTVSVMNAFGAVDYSLDGGFSNQEGPVFDGLQAGNYDLYVSDSLGCTYQDVIEVGTSVSTNEALTQLTIRLYPNPTDGIFYIEANGFDANTLMIPVGLYDSNGRIIQQTQMTKYDDTLKGVLSLYHYPSGVYYLKLGDQNTGGRLYRILRQ